jgi:hypothetical protein
MFNSLNMWVVCFLEVNPGVTLNTILEVALGCCYRRAFH